MILLVQVIKEMKWDVKGIEDVLVGFEEAMMVLVGLKRVVGKKA